MVTVSATYRFGLRSRSRPSLISQSPSNSSPASSGAFFLRVYEIDRVPFPWRDAVHL